MGFRRLCLCSNNSAAKCREKSNNGNLYLVSNTVKQFSTETPLLEPLSKVEGTCSSISVLVKNVDKLATDSKLFGNYGNISRSYLDIAEQYLSEGKFEMALSNFQFALSYSTRDTQYIPYHVSAFTFDLFSFINCLGNCSGSVFEDENIVSKTAATTSY